MPHRSSIWGSLFPAALVRALGARLLFTAPIAFVVTNPAVGNTMLNPKTSATDSVRLAIDTAYISGNSGALSDLTLTLERITTAHPSDDVAWFNLALSIYRQSAITPKFTSDDEKKLKLAEALDGIERSVKIRQTADGLALKSAIIGQSIDGFWSGMRMGRAADNAMHDALAHSPDSPFAWLLKGKASYYAPRMFGGGRDAAKESFQKAIGLSGGDSTAVELAIIRAEATAYLGLIEADEGNFDLAEKRYREALEIEPRYAWVHKSLIPALKRARSAHKPVPSN